MVLSARISVLLLLFVWGSTATTFTPISTNGDDSETFTGLWFRPDLGTAADVVPLKTRVWATRESVTGGVALKAWFGVGSTGRLAREYDPLPAQSAGITFYAKASRPITVVVNGSERSVGTRWTKVDYSWASLGTTASNPDIGYQFVVTVKGPITTDTWMIIDRVGVESPRFSRHPALSVQNGPDVTFDAASMLSGAGNLAATQTRLVAHQPFKIIAFGDSVTAGAQASRSTWAVTGDDIPKFLYFSQLARLWSDAFIGSPITTLQFGHGGWTATQALAVVDSEVVANATDADLVILEFGANDFMAGSTPDQWKSALQSLIARVKTKTNQIIVMSPTVGPGFPGDPAAISAVLAQLVTEDGVATVDVTKFMLYRGYPFAWALLANPYHPDFMGHITLAEMMAPLMTLQYPTYPPY